MPSLANEIRRLNFPGAGRVPASLFVTDERRMPDLVRAAQSLSPGSGIVFRHYGLSERARAECAARLAAVARERGLALFIANDLAIARAVGACGLHLPEHALANTRLLHAARAHGLAVTVAAHSWPAVVRAAERSVDAALVSPVFPTASHPGARHLGVLRLAWIASHASVPVYALGGVTDRNVRGVRRCGCAGVAALGALSV